MLKPIIWYLVPWSRTIYIDLIIDYTFQEKWFIRYINLFCKTFYMYYLYDVLNLLSIMSMLYHFGKRPLSIVLLPQSLSTILLRLFNLILLRLNVQSRQFYLYANYFIGYNTAPTAFFMASLTNMFHVTIHLFYWSLRNKEIKKKFSY